MFLPNCISNLCGQSQAIFSGLCIWSYQNFEKKYNDKRKYKDIADGNEKKISVMIYCCESIMTMAAKWDCVIHTDHITFCMCCSLLLVVLSLLQSGIFIVIVMDVEEELQRVWQSKLFELFKLITQLLNSHLSFNSPDAIFIESFKFLFYFLMDICLL